MLSASAKAEFSEVETLEARKSSAKQVPVPPEVLRMTATGPHKNQAEHTEPGNYEVLGRGDDGSDTTGGQDIAIAKPVKKRSKK